MACFGAAISLSLLLLSPALAGEPSADRPEKVREILVPFSELNILLENQPRRVLLTREEYDALVKKAKQSPQTKAPRPAVLLSADYVVTTEAQQARLAGTLAIDVLDPGLCAVPLDASGVGILSAKLDGRDAPLGPGPDGRLSLLLEGVGRHELKLDLAAPLETTAAQQVLSFRLPRAPVGRMRMTVPGDVELKSGAAVVSRVVDKQTAVTRFDLLPPAGDATVLMSLNSHLQRQQQAVAARCVLVDEVTTAYERLHATVTLVVLHRAIDRVSFVVPEGFEINDIASPLLARWEVVQKDNRRVATVRLREQTTENVSFTLTAIRAPARLADWRLPRLEMLDVVSQVTLIGLVAQQDLRAESLVAEDLVPVDVAVLARAMPTALLRLDPGAMPLRAVAAYYAPRSACGLSCRFVEPEDALAVTTNVVLSLEGKGCRVRGGFALMPEARRRFGIDFSVPADWKVTGVTGPDGSPLGMEYYGTADGPGRIHVRLPKGLEPGRQGEVHFEAQCAPTGWLDDWKTRQIEMPTFTVKGASSDQGALAVVAADDMEVGPERLVQLSPLTEPEKARYGLADIPTTLAYRYERPGHLAVLKITRTPPRLTARTFSFFEITAQGLKAHYELIYRVDDAKTRRLALQLPGSTPQALSIRGLGGVTVKEFTAEPVDGGKFRHWNVLLGESRRDEIRLAVDFQQPLAEGSKPQSREADPTDAEVAAISGYELPVIQADGVAYQSGHVAVEGGAELDVRVDTDARRADVGQLAPAEYQPGRRLLGAYSYVGSPLPVQIDVRRHPGYALAPTIVERAELTTTLSTRGTSQTQADFRLRTKAVYLEIRLPEGAELWSAELDGTPLKPQRDGDARLIGLPAGPEGSVRNLRLVYSSPVSTLAMTGRLRMPAPSLAYRPGSEAKTDLPVKSIALPLVSVQWRLRLPPGYEVVRNDGTLSTDNIDRPLPAPVAVAAATYFLGGGVDLFWNRSMASFPARETVRYWPAGASKGAMKKDSPKSADHKYPAKAENREKQNAAAIDDESRSMKTEDARKALDLPAPADLKAEEAKPAEPPPPAAEAPPPPTPKQEAQGGDEDREALKEATPDSRKGDEAYPVADLVLPFPEKYKGKFSRLSGVRSLKIAVQATPDDSGVVTFQSLGVEPELVITVADRSRVEKLGWALGLAVVLLGVAMTRRPGRQKFALVLGVGLPAALLPLIWDNVAVARLSNALFYGVSFLVLYYLVAAAVRWAAVRVGWLGAWLRSGDRPTSSAAVLLLVACLAGLGGVYARPAFAQEKPEDRTPVAVPSDAVILPYDAKSQTGIQDASRLLVPYDRYVELWNRAYPDKRIETTKPPMPYALAGASYTTAVEGDETLAVTGRLEIDVTTDEFVNVPLGLRGGVLARAELDGKPARLSVAQPANPSLAVKGGPAPGLLVLHVSGKGRHRLELEIRLRLSRQGGWRVVEGQLPSAPAALLAVRVPKAETEVRLTQPADRRTRETQKPDETLQTALGPRGELNLQWRPKVAEAQVDRGLTAQSTVVFDVQEDGLRAAWRLDLLFRRSQRDRFTIAVPADYLVEKVTGGNVRGWEVRTVDGSQLVDVELLKAAKDAEQMTLYLWRGGKVGQGDLRTVAVPQVTVRDAALASGQVTIRRSPSLEVRTTEQSGVSRIDLASLPAPDPAAPGTQESMLVTQACESYQFATMPFVLRMSAVPAVAKATAEVQTVVKAAEYDPTLETTVIYHVQDQFVYRLRVAVPRDLRRPQVILPCPFQWSITDDGPRRVLSVYLAQGQRGDLRLVLTGTLDSPDAGRKMRLPSVEVLDVERQQGDIALQADPAYGIECRGPAHCQEIALGQLDGWLRPEQREAARVALRYARGDYSGTLSLVPRKTDASLDTITNIRVTDRAFETTVLLNFTVEGAGVRHLSFLLPAWMRDARISVPMLRQKTIEDLPGIAADGKIDKAGPRIRVRLELQDDVTGNLGVMVQHDRIVSGGDFVAPIPKIESLANSREPAVLRSVRQYVALQTAGRDEVMIDKPVGLQTVSRQQQHWQTLGAMLRGAIAQAWMVDSGAARPQLVLRTRALDDVQTAGARIELAQTKLVLDDNGAYRAQVSLRIDNTTEQFLDVEMPTGAALWTATVADEPAKPVRSPAQNDERRVLVPILKKAPGAANYTVVLKYGGKLPSLGAMARVHFPLVRDVRSYPAGTPIGIEQSQVSIYVPKSYSWFDFAGTMHPADEADLTAGQLFQWNLENERLVQIAAKGDPYAQARARADLKIAKEKNWAQLEKAQSSLSMTGNESLSKAIRANAGTLSQVDQQISQTGKDRLDEGRKRADAVDNRDALAEVYEGQKLKVANGTLQLMGTNTYTGPTTVSGGTLQANAPPAQQPAMPNGNVNFNGGWLDRNKLANSSDAPIVPQNQPQSGLGPMGGGADLGGAIQKSGSGSLVPGQGAIVLGDGRVAQQPNDSTANNLHAGQLTISNAATLNANPAAPQLQWHGEGKKKPQKELPTGDKSDDSVVQYEQRLAQQVDEQRRLPATTTPRGSEGPQSQRIAEGGEKDLGIVAHEVEKGRGEAAPDTTVQCFTVAKPAYAPAKPTGMASLDFDLPTDGRAFHFTTPRGEVDLSARAVSNRGLMRFGAIALLVLAAAAVWYIVRRIRRLTAGLSRSTTGVLLLVVGLLGLIAGVFPLAAVAAIAAGIVVLVGSRQSAVQA